MTAVVLGAGGWGTALALRLHRRGHPTRLWARRPERAREIAAAGENRPYLPGQPVPAAIVVNARLEEALAGADLVVVAVPVQRIRECMGSAGRWVGAGTVRLSASKGIERNTLLRVSELLDAIWGAGPYAVLSGPSFAQEVARGEPTALTVASAERATAELVQMTLSSETLRIYTATDVVGVELAGALKNVIAIAAGISRGLGLGSNPQAALLTRGLAEIRRLGEALGGRPETFLGLSGMGDLILTATGSQSRNLRLGEALARGASLAEWLENSPMVAEGVETARSAQALARRLGIEMPIAQAVVQVLFEGRDPREALRELMGRELKAE